MVSSLLEYLILLFSDGAPITGYEAIRFLHEQFHVLLSPGQVYPVIDQMVEQGLLSKQKHARTVFVQSTRLGSELLTAWTEEFEGIQAQVEEAKAALNNQVTLRQTDSPPFRISRQRTSR